ncbi:hypothetical protein DOC35_19375 [Salmonella enterica subsp. enterica]|nr:hypothetical protein [Salmonella enterica subsp. enterica]
MKTFIVAAIAAAILAPCAQAKTHTPAPSLYEQIANRCMYIAATSTDAHAPETDITKAAMLCINGAEHVINHSEIAEVYQRETLATDVEQATTQEDATHAQLFLDAYDAGQLIGRAYAEEEPREEIADAKGGK